MIISHINNSYTDICLNEILLLKNSTNHKIHPSNKENALTNQDTWWSGNILDYYEDTSIHFKKTLEFFLGLGEYIFHTRLRYHYLHLIDYTNGGSMSFHNHQHHEDFVFILYLNDCVDGETNFYLKDLVSLTPKKSQIVFFESHIDHSGSFSQNKQILVGGLKKYES